MLNSNINEDKRKTERQMILFEVVKEIEECPVSQSSYASIHDGFISRQIFYPLPEVSSGNLRLSTLEHIQ